jgi:hypothetical protein
MKYLLLIVLASVSAHADVCSPRPDQWYTAKTPLATQSRVLLVTHASREFNEDKSTIAGIQATINLLAGNTETVFLHRGGFKNYMYPSCNPEWFYKSEGGEINLDLEATDTIVLIGGYYNYCLGTTYTHVSQAIRHLHKPHDIRLVYVIDGVFEAIGGLESAGGISPDQEEDLQARVGITFNYGMMGAALAQDFQSPDVLVNMLSSVYASEPFPENYTVQGHFRNRYWTNVKADWVDWTVQTGKGPKIDVYCLESRDLKSFLQL